MSRKRTLNGSPSDMLTVIEELPSDKWGKAMVLAQCLCGQVTAVRISSLIRKRSVDGNRKVRQATRSCGCLEKAAFKAYIARKAKDVPLQQKVAIWTFLKQKDNWKRPIMLGRERDGFDTAARVFDLDRGTISEVYRDVRSRFIELQTAAAWHDWMFWMKSIREELGELPYREDYKSGEFSTDDLSLSKGYLVGRMALLFERAQEIQRKWPEFKDCENPAVKEIMDLVTWTAERVGATLYRRAKRRSYVIKKKIAERSATQKVWEADGADQKA